MGSSSIARFTQVLLALVGLTGCIPERIQGEADTNEKDTYIDPESGGITVAITGSTPKAGNNGKINVLETEALQLGVTITALGGFKVDDYQVRWCLSTVTGQFTQDVCAEPDIDCSVTQSDEVNKRDGILLLKPGAFKKGLDSQTTQAVEFQLTARAIRNDKAGEDICATKAPEKSVIVNVQKAIPAPTPEILVAEPSEPFGQKCHTTSAPIITQIRTVKGYENATYTIRWYRNSLTSQAEYVGNAVATGEFVCRPDDPTHPPACDLKSDATKKGERWYVTAQVSKGQNGQPIPGAETSDPPFVDICNSWPDCGKKPVLTGAPIAGAHGKLRCVATCRDPDMDDLYAKVIWENRSTTPFKTVERVVGPFNFGGAQQADIVGEIDLGAEAPDFATKKQAVRCTMMPYSQGQDPLALDAEYPDAYGGGNFKDEVSIVNTPPHGDPKQLQVQVKGDPTLDTTYTCMLADVPSAYGDDDVEDDGKLTFTYTWRNLTTNKTLSKTGSDGSIANVAKNKPFNPPAARELVPALDATAGFVKAGEKLCCDVSLTDLDLATTPVTMPDSTCVKVDNHKPVLKVPSGDVKVSVQPDGKQIQENGPFPPCKDPNDPVPDQGQNPFTAQSLVCGTNGTPYDADGDEVFYFYTWFDCDSGDTLSAGVSSLSPPNVFARGSRVCCKIQACDSKACGPSYASPSANGVQIGNTPPSFVQDNQTGVTGPVVVPAPGSLGDKYSQFSCSASFTDCDAADAQAIPKSAKYVWRMKTGGVFTEPYLNPTPGDKVIPAGFQTQLQCGQGQELQCKIILDDQAGGTKESGWSGSTPITNDPPEVAQVSIVSAGDVTVGSKVTCKWSGLQDPNGDPVQSVRVRLRVGDKGVAGQETPDDPIAGWTAVAEHELLNPGATGEHAFDLGACSVPLTAQVVKGKLLSCDVQATDVCGATSPRIASVTPPNNDMLEIKNAKPTFLAGAVSLSPATGKKGTEYKCKVLTTQIKDCDPGEPEGFQYVYRLKAYKDGVVQPDSFASLQISKDLVGSFPFAACPPEQTFVCEVTVYDAAGTTVQDVVASNTVQVVDQKPVVTATVGPKDPKIGTNLTCSVTVDDEAPSEVKTAVQWQKNGASLAQFDGYPTITLTSSVFKKGELVTCLATADDGCTPQATSPPTEPVTIKNTAPTFAKVDLTPTAATVESKLTCLPGTWIDPDGDQAFGIEFDWEVLDPSGGGTWTKIPPGCTKKEAVGGSWRSVMDSPKDCGVNLIRAGTFVRCQATGLDSQDAVKAAAAPVASNEVLILNADPQFASEVQLVPVATLPTAPMLDADQATLECKTDVFDPDGETGWKLEYSWSLVPAGKDVSQAVPIPAPTTSALLDLSKVITPAITPCGQVFCTAKLYNQVDKVVTQAASQILPLHKGGSIRLKGGAPVVNITANPPAGSDPVAGNPQQGYVELWYWPVAMPTAGGTSKHVLLSQASVSDPWELRVAPGGVLRLAWSTSLPLDMTAAQDLAATIPVGQWSHIAVRWSLTKVYLYVNGAEVASWTTAAKPFDLGKLQIGAGAPYGPDGYLDELRVRSTTGVVPDTSQPFFAACLDNTVAVYHFDPSNGATIVDGSGHGFYGTFAGGQTAWSWHGQVDTCGTEDCDSGCSGSGNCLLPPTKVKNAFLGAKDDAATVTTYTVRCTAAGSLDLSGGAVTDYLFEWLDKDVPGGNNIAQYTAVKGIGAEGTYQEAKIQVSQADGCIPVQCRATPLSAKTGKPGPAGVSTTQLLCWSNQLPAVKMVDFNCDDGTACTQNTPDAAFGCLLANDNGAKCSASCESYELPTCSAGACICQPKCISENPCQQFTSEGPNGECNFTSKADGTACVVAGNACAATSDGTCTAGKCTPKSQVSCDDANPCTDDSCDPSNGCTHKVNAVACDDGNACTQGDTCINTFCVPGPGKVCNDNNLCTTDSCSQVTGCVFTNNTLPCQDGNECTENDACAGGLCKPGTAVICNDGNSCTDDLCHPVFGCQHVANTSTCNDGSACTLNDFCSGGQCIGAAALCNDGNPCTDDSCVPTSGCKFTPNGMACNDNNACTSTDTCNVAGQCQGTPVQCDDGNPCTTDYCLPGTGCVNENNTLSCNDGNACTVSDKCQAGTCKGVNANCNDGNQCTTDSCNPATGCVNSPLVGLCDDGNACTQNDQCVGTSCVGGQATDCSVYETGPCTKSYCTPAGGCTAAQNLENGSACTDGNACTTGDKCQNGQCLGSVLSCDDGKQCTDDSCDPAKGCQNIPNTKACDDGNPCTTGDVCKTGACTAGAAVVCNDGNPCTNDSCNPQAAGTGDLCVYVPIVIPCDDGNKCTKNDACALGVCKGETVNCNDNDVCTDDLCNPASGCYSILNDATCNDNEPCTSESKCIAGQCLGTKSTDCNDNNVCTDDSCLLGVGCKHVNNTGVCDDGKVCTEADKCASGICSGTAKLCNDADPCTSDACVEPTGCLYTGISGTLCNDNNQCTQTDVCQSGNCVGSNPKVCDDGKVCTTDSCDAATGCKFVNNTNACDDGNPCTTTDVCSNGVCVGSGGLNCDDGNPCTTDTCSLTSGCAYTNNTLPCNDNNACTHTDKCKSGSCTDVLPVNCDDGNVCTADSCDILAGCQYAPKTGPCSDNNACTDNDTCVGTSCQPGTTKVCNDNNVCTTDSCDVATGCKFSAVTGTDCDDGNACTTPDKCQSGTCVGTAVNCNDNNPCTNDSCNAATGLCQNTPVSGSCNDGNACTTSDTCTSGVCQGTAVTCNDNKVCTTDSCNPATGCVFTPLTGQGCNDGQNCTINDACDASGNCAGTPKDCDDGNVCTTDTCNSTNGNCQSANNTVACDDGTACTSGDVCKNGVCAGTAITCNDNKTCTTDTCNPATGCVFTPQPGQSCTDGDLCTVDDTCTGTGACQGPLAFCCQAGNTPGGCNLSYSGSLGSTSTYGTYSCDATNYIGGDKEVCLTPTPGTGTSIEVCMDFAGSVTGGAFVLKDLDDQAGVPSQCSFAVQPGKCAVIPSAGGTFAHYLVALDATTNNATARYHVRCPGAGVNCAAAGQALVANTPVVCNSSSGWTSTAGSFGASCGNVSATKSRLFTFTPSTTGTYSAWLGSTVAEAGAVLYVGKRTGATCVPSDCLAAGTAGKAVHFAVATASEPWCLWVDNPANSNMVSTVSFSRYLSFP
ncbi:MAG: hypothetical protein AMXMBFR64_48820 [Myxococcales bacterium]